MLDANESRAGAAAVEIRSTFAFVEAATSFNGTTADDALALPAERNVTVTGETSLVPGTELTVELSAEAAPLLKRQTVVVTAGRTWSATFDLGTYTAGTNFTAMVYRGNTPISAAIDGQLTIPQLEAKPPTTPPISSPTTTTTEPTQPTTEPTPMTVRTRTTEPSRRTQQHTTTTQQRTPGFGVAVSLLALIGAFLVVLRSRN